MYDICAWVYVFSHVCGYTCTYGCICVEDQGWYWKSSSVVLPLYSFKTGSLAEPGAHQSQQVSSQFAPEIPLPPPSEAGITGRLPCQPGIYMGFGASELPILLLACKNFSCQAIFPCIFYLREDLPTQFTKPETRSRPQLFILEVDFKETKRVTPGINSVSCPFIARLESRAWI